MGGEKKILGSVWFSPMYGKSIGIVLINNGYKEKAYICSVNGLDQKTDEEYIAKYGAKFPLEMARKLII